MSNRYENSKFVITTISENEAYLGDFSKTDGNGFVEKTNIKGEVIVPSVILNYKITGIREFATRQCSLITSLILPNTITILERAALTWCDGLEIVVFPASIITINGNNDYFHNAKRIYFEENSRVQTIGENFLRECHELTEFIFPKSLQSLGALAFDNCPKLIKCSFCGETDLSSISTPFRSSPNVLVLVTKNYKGLSFGNRGIVIVPYMLCINNEVFCKTIINNKNLFLNISISLLIYVIVFL